MTALPNAKSTLSIVIDTVTRPYANAAATTQETAESSVELELELHRLRWGASCVFLLGALFLRSSSLLHFLSSRTDECTGNGGPGSIEYSATTGRLGLSLLGLEVEALGSGALLAHDHNNQLFLGLGRRRVRAETARNLFDRLDSGDGRDLLVDGPCSRRRQLEKACRTSRTLLAGARTRSHTASERISSRGSLAEPVLRRRRSRER